MLEQGRTADFTKAIDLGDLIEVTGRDGIQQDRDPVADRAQIGG